jgi:hypothetical protein
LYSKGLVAGVKRFWNAFTWVCVLVLGEELQIVALLSSGLAWGCLAGAGMQNAITIKTLATGKFQAVSSFRIVLKHTGLKLRKSNVTFGGVRDNCEDSSFDGLWTWRKLTYGNVPDGLLPVRSVLQPCTWEPWNSYMLSAVAKIVPFVLAFSPSTASLLLSEYPGDTQGWATDKMKQINESSDEWVEVHRCIENTSIN